MSFVGAAPSKLTYGDGEFTLTAKAQDAGTGTGVWTWSSSDPDALRVTGNGPSATVKILKAGTGTKITARYESDTTLGSAVSSAFTVNKATITIASTNKNIYVGEDVPSLAAPVRGADYTVTGLAGDDTLAGDITLKYTLSGEEIAPNNSKAGSYDIIASGTPVYATADYNLVFKPGKLTISTRPSTSSGDDQTKYPVTDGNGAVYAPDTQKGISFRSTAPLAKFRSATINDKVLEKMNYTLSEGSTIVTLSPTYLNSLPAGKYALRFIFSDGYSTAEFTIGEKTEYVNPFTDVSESDYFFNAVQWAIKNKVTSGITPTTFAPDASCTRAQTVTLLWRSMGSPEPMTTSNPFTDVSADAYYYKAVLWAAEKGITGGTSATSFSPDAICSRAQTATFLWRIAGKPTVNYAMNFTDVLMDGYYTEAVRWAVSEGITSGTGDNTFSPNATCSRAQTVTFLYRYFKNQQA